MTIKVNKNLFDDTFKGLRTDNDPFNDYKIRKDTESGIRVKELTGFKRVSFFQIEKYFKIPDGRMPWQSGMKKQAYF